MIISPRITTWHKHSECQQPHIQLVHDRWKKLIHVPISSTIMQCHYHFFYIRRRRQYDMWWKSNNMNNIMIYINKKISEDSRLNESQISTPSLWEKCSSSAAAHEITWTCSRVQQFIHKHQWIQSKCEKAYQVLLEYDSWDRWSVARQRILQMHCLLQCSFFMQLVEVEVLSLLCPRLLDSEFLVVTRKVH